MSIVDPAAKSSTAPKPVAPAGAPKPVPRVVGGLNGASQAPQLKRKASGPVESNQVKIQRKEGQPGQPNGAGRSTTPSAAKPTPSASASNAPYRGTAAPSSARTGSPVVKRPVTGATSTSTVPLKAAAPAAKPVSLATGSTASAAAPKKGYLALLQKAKEKDSTKPVAPPGKHEPTKILSRKERLALKAEASAGAKGKKAAPGMQSKQIDARNDLAKEKKKPMDVGYQGTARPAKKAIEVGYRGTARPSSAPASSSRNGPVAAKAKPSTKGRYDGYADWDDLDDMEDDEEDYASDASSDMEGGMWDVEEEEQMALKVAKKEDAEALAEETRLKQEKEERKRKLLAMSKAAAAKRKY